MSGRTGRSAETEVRGQIPVAVLLRAVLAEAQTEPATDRTPAAVTVAVAGRR